MQTILCPRPQDLPLAARKILLAYPDARIFALHGPMGAGKTTLVKAFCQVLGVDDAGASPTYSLVNEYGFGSGDKVYHFDFYRINKIEEVFDLGYEDYFYSGHYCFLEWPERISELLPEAFVYISIKEKEAEVRELQYREINAAY